MKAFAIMTQKIALELGVPFDNVDVTEDGEVYLLYSDGWNLVGNINNGKFIISKSV